MPEKVKIPSAIFEYRGDFTRPIISLWLDRAQVVQALYDALSKWKLSIDDIELITTGTPSEQGFRIRLPQKRVIFFFGAASCKFTKENAGWDTAEDTIEILNAALGSLIKTTGVEFIDHKTAFALHLQPTSKPFLDILGPLLSPALGSLRYGKVKSGASVIQWEYGKVTIDASASLANGIYLRLDRRFDATTSFQDIAKELRSNEDSLFALLNVEEDAE